MRCSENGTSELLDEPLLSFFLADLLEVTEDSGVGLSSGDSLAWSGEDNVEVHTINTCGWVVLNSQVDMFIDTKSKVTYIIIKLIQSKEKDKKLTFF